MSTRGMTGFVSFIAAAFFSAVVWLAAKALAGDADPQDYGAYYFVEFILFLGFSYWLGTRVGESAWVGAVALVWVQFVIGAALAWEEDWNLWPIGVVMWVVMTIPPVFAALRGAERYRRQAGG